MAGSKKYTYPTFPSLIPIMKMHSIMCSASHYARPCDVVDAFCGYGRPNWCEAAHIDIHISIGCIWYGRSGTPVKASACACVGSSIRDAETRKSHNSDNHRWWWIMTVRAERIYSKYFDLTSKGDAHLVFDINMAYLRLNIDLGRET